MRSDLLAVSRACPSCQLNSFEDLALSSAPWFIGQCTKCRFVYLVASVDYETLSETHAWADSYIEEKKKRAQHRPVFHWLDSKTRWRLHVFQRPETYRFINNLVKSGRVLDIGCSDGGKLMRLHPGITPFGIEIGKVRAEQANETLGTRGGHCVHAPAINGLERFEDGYFDGVMLNSFLEHENHPLPLLQAMRPKMANGAVAVVKVPNFGSINAKIMKSAWCGIRIPDHVNYFTENSLSDMARKAGYAATFPRLTNLPTNDNFWAFLRPDR